MPRRYRTIVPFAILSAVWTRRLDGAAPPSSPHSFRGARARGLLIPRMTNGEQKAAIDPATLLDRRRGARVFGVFGEILALRHEANAAQGRIDAEGLAHAELPKFFDACRWSSIFREFYGSRADRPSDDAVGVPGPWGIAAAVSDLGGDPDPRYPFVADAVKVADLSPSTDFNAVLRETLAADSSREPFSRFARAVLRALLASAMAVDLPHKHVHYWLSEVLRKRLGAIIEAPPEGIDGNDALRCRQSLQDAALEDDFARRKAKFPKIADDWPFILTTTAAALTYCGPKFIDALRLAAAGPGPAVATGWFTGTLIGAYYGAERLRDHGPTGIVGVGGA
jgi:hypothetical protein